MKRSFWITLTISAVVCCIPLVLQGQHNRGLANEVDRQRVAYQEKTPASGESKTLPKPDAVSPDGTIDEERVASALAKVERLTAELGVAGAPLNEQIAAMTAALESGKDDDLDSFETRLPELLNLVESLNLEELIALVEKVSPSKARTFLMRLVAEQDPLRFLDDRSLLQGAGLSETYLMDALARVDPAAAMQRLKGNLEQKDGVRKGNKTRMRRYAALMMQDNVGDGLRELMWMRDIEDSDSMETTRFDRPSLEGVDTAQLVAAMDNPEFAEIRDDIIKMALGDQLIENGVTAVARLAESMPLTQEELTKHMETLIKYDVMASDPEATLAWIADAQPDEAQLKMVPKAFLEWAKSDAVAARDWLMEQEQSPLRDTTIANFARRAPNLDRQSAAQWALQIEDGRTRATTLRHVVRKWRGEDAAAADQWLEENGIEP